MKPTRSAEIVAFPGSQGPAKLGAPPSPSRSPQEADPGVQQVAADTSRLLVEAVEILQREIAMLARQVAPWTDAAARASVERQLEELTALLEATRARCARLELAAGPSEQ